MMDTTFVNGFVAGIVIGFIIISILLYRWRKQKQLLVQDHQSFLNVIENTKDFIYYYQLSPERKYLYLSPSAEYFFGKGSIKVAFEDPDVPYRDIHPDDYDIFIKKINGELDYSQAIIQRWKDKEGKYRYFEEYATPIYENGALIALKGVLRNIDEKIELQQEMQYLLNHDSLTHIYNRTFFEQRFLEFNGKKDISVAIILCDLDNMKYINDNLGHKKGDELLKETAKLLNQCFSHNAIVSRIGGDEFSIIVSDHSQAEVEYLIKDLLEEINQYNSSRDLRINISVGYAYNNYSIGKMEELFSIADKNMYQNKSSRKEQSLVLLS